MGFDRLVNFLVKNLNNDCIEDINLNSNIRKVIVNHLMFDISFIIYLVLIELEEEINILLKIILSLSLSIDKYNIIEKKITDYFSKSYWKNNLNGLNIENLFEGSNDDEIIQNFLNYISNINNGKSIIDNLIIEKIYDKIVEFINNVHYTNLLKSINIIFDGIPSFSKILEQRRRRVKNYIESVEKRSNFNEYFKDIKNSFQQIDELNYDYFKWLKYRFTLDKSIGPTSPIIKNLEIFLENKFKESYPHLIIKINSSNNNGEADYKIFKDIYSNNLTGDIVIHTIDSDLVHQIIVQQNYFNLIKKDINLSVIRYNYKNYNHIQIIDANLINRNLLKEYNDNNNIQYNNLNIIYDLALIFYFFGNDHLPSSYEISSELNLDYFCKIHYSSLKNNTIIRLYKNNIDFNLNNFNIFLKEINKNNEINKTKIILGKYFKISNQLIYFLTEKLKLNFTDIKLLCKKILFDDSQKIDILDPDDIRFKLKKKYSTIDYPFDISSIKNISKVELNYNLDKLLNILDYSDIEENFCGLPLYIKQLTLIEDNFQNLYLNLIDTIVNDLIKKNPIIYDYDSIESILSNNEITNISNKNNIIYSYLKKIFHLVTTLFGDMSNYTSNNITYYKYYKVPSLFLIINYLNDNNNYSQIINKWTNEIIKENIKKEHYFNSINHHLLITPFLKEILWKFNSNDLNFIVNHFDSLNYFWYNNEDFLYKDFDINEFNNLWSITLIKLSINKKTLNPDILNESEKYLLNFNYE